MSDELMILPVTHDDARDMVKRNPALGALMLKHGMSIHDVIDMMAAIRHSGDPTDPFSDHVPLTVRGAYRDIIDYPDGRHIETEYVENLVVTQFALILCGLLAQVITGSGAGPYAVTVPGSGNVYRGITYMALGTGASGWDSVPPVGIPAVGDTALVAEIATTGRQPCTVQHIDGSNAIVSPQNPTGRLLVQAVWATGQGNGSIREIGCFGGTSTATPAGTDQMVNHIVRAVLSKPSGGSDFTLTQQVRFIF